MKDLASSLGKNKKFLIFGCGFNLCDNNNIYINFRFTSLDRFKYYNKYNQNKQYCWYFIKNSKKF